MRMGRFGQIVSQARLIWLAGRGGAVEAERAKIDVIVVYKVDRLTRSLADFAKLVEPFDIIEGAQPPASASPSRGPGNGILWAETGGRFQPQNAGERPEFGSQTATRLTNRLERC